MGERAFCKVKIYRRDSFSSADEIRSVSYTHLTLRGKEQDCHSGRRDESNECRSNLSFGSSDAYGCSITDLSLIHI